MPSSYAKTGIEATPETKRQEVRASGRSRRGISFPFTAALRGAGAERPGISLNARYPKHAPATQAGHIASEGARGAESNGIGVVEGVIPHLPAALKVKEEHFNKRFTDDPESSVICPACRALSLSPLLEISTGRLTLHERTNGGLGGSGISTST